MIKKFIKLNNNKKFNSMIYAKIIVNNQNLSYKKKEFNFFKLN